MLDRLFTLETFGIKLGLHNIRRLCAALGHPERSFASLHVAGTNGKGSVTAMAHAALVASGLRAARYISPHLVDLAERFVIGDTPVSAEALQRTADDVLDCADALIAAGDLPVHPTFFEATTAIAFELFRRAGVEVAVIEVGLGGRYDSTNVVIPVAGAITSIGLDHQQHLGDTIESIAFEKAGILKPGMDLVIGALPGKARAVIAQAAAEKRAHIIDADADTRATGDNVHGEQLIIETPEDRYGPLSLALRGQHQVGNAQVAIRLLEAARRHGIRVSRESIERGLTQVDWPGRLELIRFEDGREVLLDAAHNVDGAQALAAYLRIRHPQRPALVIGAMRDKDIEGILAALLPVVSSVVATAAATPRAIPARDLAARVSAMGARLPVRVELDPSSAVEHALATSSTVCVAGSIFIVGAVRDALRRRAILR